MSNSELRKRKNKQHNNAQKPSSKRRKDKTVSSIHTSLLCLILSGTILTLFIVLYTDQIPWYIGHRAVDSIAMKFGYHKPVHAVVIDAGSTGSRVLAFTFHESYLGGHLVLDRELFEYTKPGLSSFAKEPHKGAATIENLLEKAKNEIPEEYWSKTPLILKATAGLRMLPPTEAEKLLESVRDVFRKTPFLTQENSIEIMDGVDEGIFSWFTVNFLLERLNGDPSSTVAALDLGGGSTQVTFAAQTPASLKLKENIHQAISPRGEIPVYTNSFSGLGLMAARHAVVTLNQPNKVNVTSECVNPVVKNRKFHYHGNNYYVSGLQENYPTSKVKGSDIEIGETIPIVNFKDCSQILTKYVKSKAKSPEELPLKTIFAFSYYFDRATEVGLIDESTGGHIKVKDFRKAAETSCHEANADQPFMCLDLTFIWVLLDQGFGLKENTNVNLFKKINGHEISWALGAAYDLLRR
nr:ectonucleoside triphosphate diphosphohydrolase 5 isoform X1 [Leptinotarsa decemlineata]